MFSGGSDRTFIRYYVSLCCFMEVVYHSDRSVRTIDTLKKMWTNVGQACSFGLSLGEACLRSDPIQKLCTEVWMVMINLDLT